MIWISLLLILAVISSGAGMLWWFFRRLKQIEEDLWGKQAQEAQDTAETLPENTPEPEES